MVMITISISIFLYLITSFFLFKQGDYPIALVWACYAMANVGMLWYEFTK